MNLEQQRAAAHRLCDKLAVNVLPYGNAWWLLGDGISQVVGEIAGLTEAKVTQMQRSRFARK